jgi:hypothetical protein
MAFLKLNEVIVNTSFVAAVRLEGCNRSGEARVALLIAIPTFPFSKQETPLSSSYQYEWLEFKGDEAKALEDYFSSYNNVIDLLPSQQCYSHEV